MNYEKMKVITVLEDYVVEEDDQVIFVDASAGEVLISLPGAALWEGKPLHIKKIDDSKNKVTIDCDAGDLLEGLVGLFFEEQYDCLLLVSDTHNWYRLDLYR